jgi:hypothetical protein
MQFSGFTYDVKTRHARLAKMPSIHAKSILIQPSVVFELKINDRAEVKTFNRE